MLDPSLATQVRRADPERLGAKLREARIAAGLSQGEVAAGEVTISFVSRIETGKRRADPALIARLAERVGLTVDSLLVVEDEPEFAPYVPALQFTETAIGLGDSEAALAHLDSLAALTPPVPLSVGRRVQVLRAAVHELRGEDVEAIELLEPLLDEPLTPMLSVRAATVLGRCYTRTGQQVRAVRVGETALAALDERTLRGTDDAVQLALVVAGAYADQGDREYAVRLVRRVLEDAEALGSPATRAAAYWRAAVLEVEHGEVTSAVALARQALELLHRVRDVTDLARLRSQLGRMELRLDPPELDRAIDHLTAADADLRAADVPADVLVHHDLALARHALLAGEAERASQIARRVREERGGETVEALCVEGEAAMALGDTEAARAALTTAADELAARPAERATGQAWMDVAGLLEQVGDNARAQDAYRRAALAAGLAEDRRST